MPINMTAVSGFGMPSFRESIVNPVNKLHSNYLGLDVKSLKLNQITDLASNQKVKELS